MYGGIKMCWYQCKNLSRSTLGRSSPHTSHQSDILKRTKMMVCSVCGHEICFMCVSAWRTAGAVAACLLRPHWCWRAHVVVCCTVRVRKRVNELTWGRVKGSAGRWSRAIYCCGCWGGAAAAAAGAAPLLGRRRCCGCWGGAAACRVPAKAPGSAAPMKYRASSAGACLGWASRGMEARSRRTSSGKLRGVGAICGVGHAHAIARVLLDGGFFTGL